MSQTTHLGCVFHASGLNLSSLSHLYRLGHASTLALSSSFDPVLQNAIQATLDEETQNTAQHAEVVQLSQGVKNKGELKTKGRELSDFMIEDVAKTKVLQGEHGWMEALSLMDSDIPWKSCLVGLSEATFSFATRALVDALPTNSNLARWKKVLSSQCGSCHSTKQTLLHVLNHCQSKLDAYTWRHNNVLLQMKNFICSKVMDAEILCDILVKDNQFQNVNVNTVPCDIIATNLRPDMCIIKRDTSKSV